jgi:hypothetical protein
MTNTTYTPITLRCPECSHDVARAVVSSYSIITVACGRCAHQWTVEIRYLSDQARAQIPNVEGRAQYAKRSA